MASNGSAHHSIEKLAANCLSIAISPDYENLQAVRSDDTIVRYERDKKKAYVQLNTNLGPLTMELYLDLVPKTCEHFMRQCQNGSYDGTIFQRSVRNSMVCFGRNAFCCLS